MTIISPYRFSFDLIEEYTRQKTFGLLSTVSKKNRPHQTGTLYEVSPPESKFALFIPSSEKTAKIRNIRNNSEVSFIIPFPHNYFRFVPSSTITYRGKAELTTIEDADVQRAFSAKRILRYNLKADPELLKELVIIKINPESTVFCFGIGISLLTLARSHTHSTYKVKIPPERL